MEVNVYVCPTPGCGNYYGASGMPDLHREFTGPKTEDRHQVPPEQSPLGMLGVRHTRAECPDCRQQGTRVERRLATVWIPNAKHPPILADRFGDHVRP